MKRPYHNEISKIDRIRQAALIVMSDNGISHTSVSSIAKHAGVSDGYLYRHYKGKEELIDDLLTEIFNKVNDEIAFLLNNCNTIDEIVSNFIYFICTKTKEEPEKIKFLIMLQNDFSYKISKDLTNRLVALCEEILEQGRSSCSIRTDITPVELYIALVGIPLQYYSIYFRNMFGMNDVNEMVKIIIKQSLLAIK